MKTIKSGQCLECGGRGIEFRGTGLNLQYKICSAYKNTDTPANHPTYKECMEELARRRRQGLPNGRWA